MRTNRKTEEKKMSMSKNIARLAVTAGLTAALSFGGVMAPVTMAFAEGKPTVAQSGNVTITDSTYTDTTFKGIQIFKATVTQDKKDNAWNGDKTLSDITWASGGVRDAVTAAFVDTTDSTKPSGTDAQEWADWIKSKTDEEYKPSGTNDATKLDAGTTLDKIAKALEGAKIAEGTDGWRTSTNGTFADLNTGYWLFVTAHPGSTKGANTTNGNDDAYSSPIFTVVGGADVKAEPKKDVPNVTKAVMDDKDSKFVTDDSGDVFTAANKAADSAADQLVEYQLAGTVASNNNTYEKYSYTFTDNLPSTMVPELQDGDPVVEVKIGNTGVKGNCYKASYDASSNTLTVSFDNLKEAQDPDGKSIAVDGNSKVYVNYKAKLDANKITQDMLGKAQKNYVKLTYSNNPHDNNGTGTTVDHPAYDYTYGIDVTKVGSDKDETGNPKTLKGVQFTLQEKDSNNFIKADGTTTSTENEAILTTTDDGKINVVGLDEGTYILKEVKPAPGYNNSAASGVTFTISRTLNQDGTDVTPDTTSAIVAGEDVIQQNSAKAEVGKLSFTIVDQKGSGLPLTGLNGVTFTWIAGGAVLCIGVAHLIRSRKQAEESEQE